MRLILPILLVVVLTGCLEKPAPWKPDGMGRDEDSEVDATGADGTAELAADAIADGMADAVPDIEEPDVSPVDTDVSIAPGSAPIFMPSGVAGTSSGKGWTLRAAGPPGHGAGQVSAGGNWKLTSGSKR
jgi:hypothetical protein